MTRTELVGLPWPTGATACAGCGNGVFHWGRETFTVTAGTATIAGATTDLRCLRCERRWSAPAELVHHQERTTLTESCPAGAAEPGEPCTTVTGVEMRNVSHRARSKPRATPRQMMIDDLDTPSP